MVRSASPDGRADEPGSTVRAGSSLPYREECHGDSRVDRRIALMYECPCHFRSSGQSAAGTPPTHFPPLLIRQSPYPAESNTVTWTRRILKTWSRDTRVSITSH